MFLHRLPGILSRVLSITQLESSASPAAWCRLSALSSCSNSRTRACVVPSSCYSSRTRAPGLVEYPVHPARGACPTPTRQQPSAFILSPPGVHCAPTARPAQSVTLHRLTPSSSWGVPATGEQPCAMKQLNLPEGISGPLSLLDFLGAHNGVYLSLTSLILLDFYQGGGRGNDHGAERRGTG